MLGTLAHVSQSGEDPAVPRVGDNQSLHVLPRGAVQAGISALKAEQTPGHLEVDLAAAGRVVSATPHIPHPILGLSDDARSLLQVIAKAGAAVSEV